VRGLAEFVPKREHPVLYLQKISDGPSNEQGYEEHQRIGRVYGHLDPHDYGDETTAGEDDLLEVVLHVLSHEKPDEGTHYDGATVYQNG